jgi:hypothetical protein
LTPFRRRLVIGSDQVQCGDAEHGGYHEQRPDGDNETGCRPVYLRMSFIGR